MQGVLRYGAFTIVEEGPNLVATNMDEVSDGAYLEIQSDSYDTLIEALKTIDRVCENYNPATRAFGPMPDWLIPFLIHGDPARVVLPSKDLRRLLSVPPAVRDAAHALLGLSVTASVWASLSCRTFAGLRHVIATSLSLS